MAKGSEMSSENQNGQAKRGSKNIVRYIIELILFLVAVEALIALYFQWRQVDQLNAELRMAVAEGHKMGTQVAMLEDQLQKGNYEEILKETEIAIFEDQRSLESTLAAVVSNTLLLQETLISQIGPQATSVQDTISRSVPTPMPTPTLTDVPTYTPTSSSNILFSDVFEGESAETWMPAFGSWSISGGRYVCASSDEAWSSTGEDSWTDYRVIARVRLSGDLIKVGVIGRFQDEQHFYMAQLYGGSARIYRRKNGWQELVSVPYRIENGSWYKIGLELSGKQIHMYINDGLIASVEDETYPSGKIGLYCSRIQAYFDDIIVTQATK